MLFLQSACLATIAYGGGRRKPPGDSRPCRYGGMTNTPPSMTRPLSSLPPYKPWYRYGRRSLTKRQWWFRLGMAWQRATRGYSDDQCWSLSYPAELSEEMGGRGGWDRWDGILAEIEEGFQAWIDCDRGWFHNDPAAEKKFKRAMELSAEWFGAL